LAQNCAAKSAKFDFGFGDKMPHFDSVVVKEKMEKKVLRLILEDGDDVVASIKQAMQDNNIRECKVEDVSGKLKQATVNCMEGSSYKRIDVKDKAIMRASGTFKFGGGDLWGTLHIFTEGRKPVSGTMLAGKAAEGFELKLSFLPDKKLS
jgi:predicted DNA-binding protein with PD1-like motif